MKTLTKMSDATNAITKMPAFNKTIQIELDVDSVYKRMLDLLPGDYKHREVLSHAIVGAALAAGNLTYVCKALHGYTNDIDFQVDNQVVCTEMARHEYYDANQETEQGLALAVPVSDHAEPEYKPDWQRRAVVIGQCKVVEIDLYAMDKLKVEFESEVKHYGRNPHKETRAVWVSHTNCTRVPVEDKW